jgi:hypothetical protein
MTGVALRMSSEAVGWVLRDAPDVPAQCVCVLIGLAEHADKRGRGAYPSAGTLAAYARKSERMARYDIKVLVGAGLIRPGDQSLVAKYPPNRRPVVYDLAMERSQAAAEVQSPAPQEAVELGVQPTAEVQPTAPQAGWQPIAPLNGADLQEHDGVQPIAPLNGSALGCNTASLGVQPTSYKPPMNLNPVTEVGEGGSGGDGSAQANPLFDADDPAGADGKPKRDLNAGRDDAMRLCVHLAERVEANGSGRPEIGKKWLDAARLLIDTDKRTEEQIHRAIDWCQDSEWWRPHILSMPRLREKYNTLRLQAGQGRRANGNGAASESTGAQRAQQALDAGKQAAALASGGYR